LGNPENGSVQVRINPRMMGPLCGNLVDAMAHQA
jgi:hypothetical protein